MTSGQRIKEARKRAGLTQAELAKRLGIAYQTLAQWENDLRNPKYETCRRIADALGINILYLLTSEEMDKGILDLIKADYDSDDAFYRDFIEKKVSLMLLNNDVDRRLVAAYSSLNEDGQQEAVKRVEELTEIPRYRTETAPQSPPAAQEGKDTTPPPEGSEGPQEGE